MLTEKRDSEHEIDGQKYYDVEIVSPDIRYLMTFTVNMGKVYAFLVKSPTKARTGLRQCRFPGCGCCSVSQPWGQITIPKLSAPC